jgi:hypothetical protein
MAPLPIQTTMEENSVGDKERAPGAASSRIPLLARLPGLVVTLLTNVAAVYICVRLLGVWPTVALWSLVFGFAGFAVLRRLRLRAQR